MAFGIDDALMTAAAGISLTDTIVETIRRYRAQKVDPEFGELLGEVKNTMGRRIKEADLALIQFERMLTERGIDIDKSLANVIEETPFWKPFEQHRLNQIRRRFNEFSDSVYSSGDDIAALARCRQQTGEFGVSVVETIAAKHDLHASLIDAKSVREAIGLLRSRLAEYQGILGSL